MQSRATSIRFDEAARQVDLVFKGYTVSSWGRCMARIGAAFVMRDAAGHCVRIPAASTDAKVLSALWAEFSRPESDPTAATGKGDAAQRKTAHAKKPTLVLQGYKTDTHGICLARVVGHYATADGVRHSIPFVVEHFDPEKLKAAWAAFSAAAGWARAACGVGAESLHQPFGHLVDIRAELGAND